MDDNRALVLQTKYVPDEFKLSHDIQGINSRYTLIAVVASTSKDGSHFVTFARLPSNLEQWYFYNDLQGQGRMATDQEIEKLLKTRNKYWPNLLIYYRFPLPKASILPPTTISPHQSLLALLRLRLLAIANRVK